MDSTSKENPADSRRTSSSSSHDTDHLLNRLGNPGRFQILLFVLLSTQYFPVAMNDLMPLFYSIQPTEVHCRDGDVFGNSSHHVLRDDVTSGQTNDTGPVNKTVLCDTPCRSGYVYTYPDRQWSIVADVSLKPFYKIPHFLLWSEKQLYLH